MEAVTRSTQDSLSTLGILARTTHEGENVRIAWTGPGGSRLAFILTSVKTPTGEVTRVHLDVEKGADQASGLKILADLEARHGRAS